MQSILRAALGSVVVAGALLATPAANADPLPNGSFTVAQYWGGWGPPPPPPPGYYRPYGPPPGYGPPSGYGRPPGYYVPPQQRVRYGVACYTSRGTCHTDAPVPIGTSCRCFIPGFGPKRGNVI